MPNTRNDGNNHGSWAQVGDLVEILNPMGESTGIHGLVQSVELVTAITPKRYLWLYGEDHRIKDSCVRVVSQSLGA